MNISKIGKNKIVESFHDYKGKTIQVTTRKNTRGLLQTSGMVGVSKGDMFTWNYGDEIILGKSEKAKCTDKKMLEMHQEFLTENKLN